MAVQAVCPGCQSSYDIPEDTLGRTVRCQKCQTTFVLTAATGTAPPEPVLDAVPVVEAVAPPAPPAETRRLPPRPRRRRPQREESAGSVLVPILVVGGVLVTIIGIVVAVIIAVHYINSDNRPVPTATAIPKGMPGPGGMPPGAPPNFQEFNDPAGDTPLSFEVGNLDAPGTGLTRFRPASPLPDIKQAAANADATMSPETLKKVKASTALLQVAMAAGNGEGSGFFAFEPGLLITNAHVVGMVGAAETKPTRVDVVLNSGESNERRLRGEVLAVDRYVDLALIRVRGTNLPPPLPIGRVKDVYETQRIYTVGFPFGSGRSHNVTVAATTVSSLVKTNGEVRKVQVVGAMNPGNSGGPVVDVNGQVIAVAVAIFLTNSIAGMSNTDISYALPCDDVHYLYQGRLDRLDVGQPVSQGMTERVPFAARFYDPAGRIRKAGVTWWIDAAGKGPDASSEPPPAKEGVARQTIDLKLDHSLARGDLDLPPLPAGKVYWLQPFFQSVDNKTRYCAAVAYKPPAAIQSKPVQITAAPGDGSNEIALSYRSGLELHGHNKEMSLLMQSKAKLRDAGTDGPLRTFTDFDLGLRVNGTPVPRNIFRSMTQGRTQSDDDDTKPQAFRSEVKGPLQTALGTFGGHFEELVACLDVTLPGPTLTPEQTWTTERTLSPDAVLSKAENKRVTMNYAYIGTRTRSGRDEAAVTIRGDVQLTDPKRTELRVDGLAWVDVATGKVSLARATFDLDTNVAGPQAEHLAAAGAIEVRLERKR